MDHKVFFLHGRSPLSEFLEDRVVFRNLAPVDPELPSLGALRPRLGLAPHVVPRKAELEYARVVAEMLRHGVRMSGALDGVQSLIMVGDTEHSDGAAFHNLCEVLGCPGAAFICDENHHPARIEAVTGISNGLLYRANRWGLLAEFNGRLGERGMDVGPGTAVVVDIDKTALGARGRNHWTIDAARTAAALRTVTRLLDDGADDGLVLDTYARFNEKRYHPFTTDNQDYVAYVCVLVGSGWATLEDLAARIEVGDITNFDDLLRQVSDRVDGLAPPLRQVHNAVAEAVALGDPTPFKEFRYSEFEETVSRMGRAEDPCDLDEIMATEITVTHEVREMALAWKARGALLFGLSDKPDEASIPSAALAAQGFLPLHHTPAWVVGEAQ